MEFLLVTQFFSWVIEAHGYRTICPRSHGESMEQTGSWLPGCAAEVQFVRITTVWAICEHDKHSPSWAAFLPCLWPGQPLLFRDGFSFHCTSPGSVWLVRAESVCSDGRGDTV